MMCAQFSRLARRVAASLLMALSVPAAFAQATPPTVLASFPNGTFLENADLASDGTLFFTSYLERRIYTLKPGGQPQVWAQLPAHPVAVLLGPDAVLVSAHGQPFTAGPAFTQTQQMLTLGLDGTVRKTVALPQARFLNGMARLGEQVLIADSITATIWSYNPATGDSAPWLQHEALSQDATVKGFKPGANGLKRVGDVLWFSNSSRGTLSSVRVEAGRPTGAPRTLAKLDGIDDFWPLADGSFAVASHAKAVYRVAANGTVSSLLESGCEGCTAVVAADAGAANLLLLTTGSLLEGGKGPAQVLSLRVR